MSVTPVARGVLGPLIVTAAALTGLVLIANTWSWPRHHAVLLSLVVIIPAAVLGGRLLRWQSHKIVVTSQRIIERGGVLRRRLVSFELIDIHATHLDQRLLERMARRGFVVLEMGGGTVVLERVRRPDALLRVIDHQRQQLDRRSEVQLARADELSEALEAGLLTNEEYDQRWRHLFGPGDPRS